MGKRANRNTPAWGNRRASNIINSRRLARVRRAEAAWEAESAAPLRELLKAGPKADLYPWEFQKQVRLMQQKNWPTRNKTKRGFMIFGITKSMLSRMRRKLNDLVVAD